MNRQSRAVSPIISVILIVAIVVILSATISVFVLDIGTSMHSEAPSIVVSHEFVDAVDGGEKAVAITLDGGNAVQTDRLYVSGSKALDIGGHPDTSSQPANDDYASTREKFTETAGATPQVEIGETWEAGETVYIDPEGSADHVTISIYWTSQSVEGVNPGTPTGQTAYKIETVEVGSTA